MSGGGSDGGEAEGPRTNVFGEAPTGSVDLNLTALMDILSNLLFFLLASFGATIVMAINGTVPVQSSEAADPSEAAQKVTASVRMSSKGYDVAAQGQQDEAELGRWHKLLPPKAAEPDYTGLAEHLARLKAAFPLSDTMLLIPEAGVPYEQMVKTMDAARERAVGEIKSRGGLAAGAEAAAQQREKLFPTVVVSTVIK